MLWVVQGLLAAVFLMVGGFKLMTPADAFEAQGMTIAPIWLRIAGVSEVLGALGLVLPSAFRIAPILTPVAASLLALVVVLAAVMHVMLGEMGAIGMPLVLAALCAFVAWGRFTRAPIS